MPDLPISGLPAATTPLAGTEIVPVVQSGTTDRVTVANLTAGRAVAGLSFTSTGGTVTASAPIFNGTQTWNSGGVTFTGALINVTDTASASGSLLQDWQIGGSSRAFLRKDGIFSAAGAIRSTSFDSSFAAGGVRTIMDLDTSGGFSRFGSVTGGGTAYGVRIISANNPVWQWSTSGHYLAATDNTYDIGASGANRPRNIYVAGNVTANNFALGANGSLGSSGDGVFLFRNNATTNSFTITAAGSNIAVFSGRIVTGESVVASGATAIPAGGANTLGLKATSTANFGVFFGSGVPTLSAAKGSLYLRSDGSTTNDRMYVNTDGAAAWTAVITAA